MLVLKLLIVSLYFFEINCSKEYCALRWVESGGDMGIPSTSVASDGKTHLVVRVKVSNVYVLGRLNATEHKAYYRTGNNIGRIGLAFEILTNPLGCILAWVSSSNPDLSGLAVRPTSGANSYVGRAETISGLLSGEVNPSTSTLYVSFDGTVKPFNGDSYYVLISYSNGLHMEMSDFEMVDTPGGAYKMLGSEEIQNEGETEVSLTIVHREIVSETYRFTSSIKWEATVSVKATACIFFFLCGVVQANANIGAENSNYFDQSGTLGFKPDRDVTVKRTLTVPPYQHLIACSLYGKEENFISNWTATATFTRPGKTAHQVIDELNNLPEWSGKVWETLGNTVSTEISGRFNATFATGTQFFVTEKSETTGCVAIQKFLTEAEKHERDPHNERKEIQRILALSNGFSGSKRGIMA